MMNDPVPYAGQSEVHGRRRHDMAWFGRSRDEQQAQGPGAVKPEDLAALDDYSRTIINVVSKVGPAVVQVGVTKAVTSRTAIGIMPRIAEGAGSGVVFAPDGYILTNSHVVDGARSITITLSDGHDLTGTVVGEDPETDVAVVRVTPPEGKPLTTARLGNSDMLHVGQLVVALGSPSCPTWSMSELPSRAVVSGLPSGGVTRTTATSVSGSSPTTVPVRSWPSERVMVMLRAPSTTWLFVRI